LSFKYRLTCYGHPYAYHQELGNSSAVGRVRAGPDRPRPTALLPPRSYGKPEAAVAVNRFLMMGIRMPETC
jgi:hypothetical protein